MSDRFVISVTRLHHDQSLFGVDDSLADIRPENVNDRWVLVKTTLDRSLSNDTDSAVFSKEVSGKCNNLASLKTL